jgi:kynurenine formamidase
LGDLDRGIARVTKRWGRWGPDDERGALNRITGDVTLRAARSIRSGEVRSLAVPLEPGRGPIFPRRQPMQHFMTRHGGDYAAGLPEKGFGFADEYILIATHGTTHIDALSHVWKDGLMWNGYSANSVTSVGAQVCDMVKAGPIVTRAVFVDLFDPGATTEQPIRCDELVAGVEATGVTPEEGDALLVRTGWLHRWRAGTATVEHWSGLDVDCAEWIDDMGFALVGADNIAVEYGPTGDPTDAAPLHVALIRNCGVYLLELLDLEAIAATGRHDFLLSVAPMPLVGGVGSPVNPVAVL